MSKIIDIQYIHDEAERRVNRFSYDGFFHYLVKHHDGIRKTLCQKMIEGHTIVETTVVDGQKEAEFYDSKNLVLDILAKDESGNLYNIEMQCYTINQNEMIRFQLYDFRVIADEAKSGIEYKEVKPLKQMIINASKPIEGLSEYIHHFELYDKQNQVSMPYSLFEVYIIQLAYLEMENINIEEFDELMYLFKNDKAYDKIEVHRNVLEAINMHIKFNMSEERYKALRRERDEMTRAFREQYALEQAEKEGMAQGITQGIVQTKIEDFVCLYEKKLGTLSQTTKEKVAHLSVESINELMLLVFDIETEEELLSKL